MKTCSESDQPAAPPHVKHRNQSSRPVFFFPSLTHVSANRRSTNSLLGQAAAEKILPLDILSFWHNIDFRGEVAGGSLVTFHITLEIYAQLSVCTNSSGGGGGWRERVGGWGRGMMKEGEMGRERDECTDKYSS